MADNENFDPPQRADSTGDHPGDAGHGNTAQYPTVPPPYAAPQNLQPAYGQQESAAFGGYAPPAGMQPAGPPSGGYEPPTPYGVAYPPGYPAFAQHAASGPAAPVRRRSRARKAVPLLILVIVAALIGGVVGATTVAIADRHSTNTGLRITNDTGVPAAKTDGTIGAAADRIRPSVVTINVSNGQSAGTGSGVIIRSDGYILTNDHVVSVAASGGTMQVTLTDGRTASGTIVGRDTSDDLAVVKVSGLSNLTSATFARSVDLTVGQTVVAVGAPLGLSDTVTSGIVSNTARPVRSGDNDQAVFQAIQTDAAINPGNSGGPLVDLNGSVVGINSAIATDNSGGGLQIPGQSQQSGSIGIGFAIPSDEASRIAGELIAGGKAYHAVLEVSVRSTPSATTPGVQLSAVTAGGAGAAAGLKVGDLITAIGSTKVATADALIAAVRAHAPGDLVTVTYTRGGQSATASVTLGKSAT